MQNREQIFNEIVKDNREGIYRICLAWLYNKSFADDLYQEIMLQIWKSIERYRGDAKLSTWVYRIAVNTAITYNHESRKSTHSTLPETFNIADDTIGMAHEKEQKLTALQKAISQLEEQDRLIISLVLEDLTYKEIAEITGTNVNNTGVRIARIKTRLMKLMENLNA